MLIKICRYQISSWSQLRLWFFLSELWIHLKNFQTSNTITDTYIISVFKISYIDTQFHLKTEQDSVISGLQFGPNVKNSIIPYFEIKNIALQKLSDTKFYLDLTRFEMVHPGPKIKKIIFKRLSCKLLNYFRSIGTIFLNFFFISNISILI